MRYHIGMIAIAQLKSARKSGVRVGPLPRRGPRAARAATF
jgi:hypothetical protein